MEVAGVALGVVPVAILAATTYRTLHDYLQILRASDTVANRVLLSLRCLELRLHRMFSEFLGDVLPDHDPWELFRNDSLTDQQKSAISIHVKSSLGPDSTTCEGVLKEISNIFDEVSTSLHSIKMAASDSSVVSAIHRDIWV